MSPGVNCDDLSVLRTWAACDGPRRRTGHTGAEGRSNVLCRGPRTSRRCGGRSCHPPLQPVSASTLGEPAPWVPHPHASVCEPLLDRVSLPESPPYLGPRPCQTPYTTPASVIWDSVPGASALLSVLPLLLASSLERSPGQCSRAVHSAAQHPVARRSWLSASRARVAPPRFGGRSQ